MKKIAILITLILIFAIFAGYILFNTNNSDTKKDTDGDGFYDQIDAFPDDPAASRDTDLDGYPDRWNDGKTQDDSTSNLIKDDFPNDPAASLDSDHDGYPDQWNSGKDQGDSNSIPPLQLDEYPNDKNAHIDTDKDGFADYYDIYDFADLKLNLKLDKFKVTEQVDLFKRAQVYFEVYIDNKKIESIDNNGKFYRVWLFRETKISHEVISYDIPDNTKSPTTKIEIKMFDYDLIGSDDIIDISEKNGENTLILEFDNKANKISDNGETMGSSGVLWYEISYTHSDVPDTETYKKTYRWNYKSKQFRFSVEIPVDLYQAYKNSEVKRNPNSDTTMAEFVKPYDEVIKECAKKIDLLSKEEGYDSITKANLVLKFVQQIMSYEPDEDTAGQKEYWRFPVETLVEMQGDCEDSAVLYASIMKALNYDVALLLYTWEDEGDRVGHMAVGLHLDGNYGSYVVDNTGKKYFYCETTTVTYNIGKLPPEPPEISKSPQSIIHI